MKLQSQQGFTLMELLLVITVLGILGTVAVSTLTDSSESAREKAALAGLAEIQGRINTQFMRYANAGNSCKAAQNQVSDLTKLADRTEGSDPCFGQFCINAGYNTTVTATGKAVQIRFAGEKTWYKRKNPADPRYTLTLPACDNDLGGHEPTTPEPTDPDAAAGSGVEGVQAIIAPYNPVAFNPAEMAGRKFNEIFDKGNLVTEDGKLYIVTDTSDKAIDPNNRADDAKYKHLLKSTSAAAYFTWHEDPTSPYWTPYAPPTDSLCVVADSSGNLKTDRVWVWVGAGSPAAGPVATSADWIRVTANIKWPSGTP